MKRQKVKGKKMTSEESAEQIKTFLHSNIQQLPPQLAEALKTAVTILTIDASKQKMKERVKEECQKN